MEKSNQQKLGKLFEELACQFLSQRGYEILERNWRHQNGEIDIICTDGKSIIFVEVKGSSGEGNPEIRIDDKKLEHIYLGIEEYIHQHEVSLPVEVHAIAVEWTDENNYRVVHFKDV